MFEQVFKSIDVSFDGYSLYLMMGRRFVKPASSTWARARTHLGRLDDVVLPQDLGDRDDVLTPQLNPPSALYFSNRIW
jgi:hypothetical protein